jgi:purine-binding chemotaxis protein CheW
MEIDNPQLKSELILDELKDRQRSREIVDVEQERVKMVIFRSGANRYAFYGSVVREILPASEISWVPGLPDYLPGLINVRGDIESVVNIGYFLGEEKKERFSGLIAMVVKDDFHTGILIDSIDDVLDIPLQSITPPLSTLDGAPRELVVGNFEYDKSIISILDIGKLASKVSL